MKSTQDLAAFRREQGFAPNPGMDAAILAAATINGQTDKTLKKKSQ